MSLPEHYVNEDGACHIVGLNDVEVAWASEDCPVCRAERAEARVKKLEVESQLLRDMAKTGELQDSHDWWFPLDVRLRFAAFERVLRGEEK